MGVSTMKERRRYERFKAILEVEYNAEDGFSITAIADALDISESGVSIPLTTAIKPGQKVKIRIKLPSEGKEIEAVGKVVWMKPINKNFAPEENAGIEFL